MLDEIDEDVMQDEVNDEHESFFAGQRTPKTCNKPKNHETMSFIEEFPRQSDIKIVWSVITLSFLPKVYHLVNKFGDQFPYQK